MPLPVQLNGEKWLFRGILSPQNCCGFCSTEVSPGPVAREGAGWLGQFPPDPKRPLYGVGGCPKSVPVALPALPSPKSLGQELMPSFARERCSGQINPIPKGPWELGMVPGPAGNDVFGTWLGVHNTTTTP